MKGFLYLFLPAYLIFSSHAADHETFQNQSLRKAYHLCEAFIDFEHSNLKENEERKIIEPSSIQCIEGNIRSAKILKNRIFEYDRENKKSDGLLKELLETRFEYLNHRATIIREVRENIKKDCPQGRPVYGPTDPNVYNGLPGKWQFLARISTDRYQLINQMILYVWETIDKPETLKPQIKTLLRCSTTFWPNLTGERDYLGHPDEAILTYDDEKFPFEKDIQLYCNHIEKFDYTTKSGHWARHDFKMKVTKYWLDDKEKIKDMPYPDWLRTVPHPSLSPQALGMPEPAKIQPSGAINAPINEPGPVEPLPELAQPTNPIWEVEDDHSIMQQAVLPALAMPEEPMEQTSQVVGSSSSASSVSEISMSLAMPPVQALTTPHRQATQRDIRQRTSAAHAGLPFPRSEKGLKPGNPNRYASLKKKPQGVIDTIFGHQGYNSLTFGEFKRLWIKLHGEKSVIENTGSSHKKLISSDGKVFPIFAHGDGMKYTKNTIRYLREALEETGYFPL